MQFSTNQIIIGVVLALAVLGIVGYMYKSGDSDDTSTMRGRATNVARGTGGSQANQTGRDDGAEADDGDFPKSISDADLFKKVHSGQGEISKAAMSSLSDEALVSYARGEK